MSRGTSPSDKIKNKTMNTEEIKSYLQFKASQFFRLRGVEIPKAAEAQRELLSTIPQETKKQWAAEVIQMGAK